MTPDFQVDISDVQVVFGSPEGDMEPCVYWSTAYWGPKIIRLQLSASEQELKSLGFSCEEAGTPDELLTLIYADNGNFNAMVEYSKKAIILETRRQLLEAKQTIKDLNDFLPVSEVLEM